MIDLKEQCVDIIHFTMVLLYENAIIVYLYCWFIMIYLTKGVSPCLAKYPLNCRVPKLALTILCKIGLMEFFCRKLAIYTIHLKDRTKVFSRKIQWYFLLFCFFVLFCFQLSTMHMVTRLTLQWSVPSTISNLSGKSWTSVVMVSAKSFLVSCRTCPENQKAKIRQYIYQLCC